MIGNWKKNVGEIYIFFWLYGNNRSFIIDLFYWLGNSIINLGGYYIRFVWFISRYNGNKKLIFICKFLVCSDLFL